MIAKIIDGKVHAAKIRAEVAQEINNRIKQNKTPSSLAVILVGDDPASHIYVKNKRLGCDEVGIKSLYFNLPKTTSTESIKKLIIELNENKEVNGILLQLPLPDHVDTNILLETIDPKKDIDGFHPYNLGKLAQRNPILRPCTPFGIMSLLDSIGETYQNRHAVIVGSSMIVGRPMALELLMAGCTITICHRLTHDLSHFIKQADILVSATGVPTLIKGDWIKPGATVIDVGITRLPDGKITGDVEFERAKEKAAWITPVPGGVGPMTTAMLLKNTLLATKLQENNLT